MYLFWSIHISSITVQLHPDFPMRCLRFKTGKLVLAYPPICMVHSNYIHKFIGLFKRAKSDQPFERMNGYVSGLLLLKTTTSPTSTVDMDPGLSLGLGQGVKSLFITINTSILLMGSDEVRAWIPNYMFLLS